MLCLESSISSTPDTLPHVSALVCRSKLGRVASFREHVNRRERVALSLSPCMRYVAVGSEDRCLYLYDARRGAAAAKTQVRHRSTGGALMRRCPAMHPWPSTHN